MNITNIIITTLITILLTKITVFLLLKILLTLQQVRVLLMIPFKHPTLTKP